ncbi:MULTISPECIES: hypothetical protein [unclassified Sutcliffiella]|uniref:hypothetical protein n=1 Tax=unclassified Sutcliffiella TaxID=2837532 RepID=UPI0030D5CDC9
MKKTMLLGLISSALLLGGCGMKLDSSRSQSTGEKNAPNSTAFNDEFSKDFFKSSEQVVEGHYLFESQTGGYTIHIPINASLDKAAYERAGDEFEAVGFVENDEKENLSFYYNINYDDQPRANDIEFKLDMFDTYLNYTGNFEEYTKENTTYYYAENVFEYEGKKSYRYFAYIKPDIKDKGVNFIGRVTCIDYEKPCTQESNHAKEMVLNIMHSIDFKSR